MDPDPQQQETRRRFLRRFSVTDTNSDVRLGVREYQREATKDYEKLLRQ